MAPVRILIADDHEIVRRGVRSLLKSRSDWSVCGEAVDGLDAISKARELKPDVIVLDISMPRLNGLDAARQIRKEVPQSEILILSQHGAAEMERTALSAGARAYVSKTDVSRDLLAAVEALSQHHSPRSLREVAPEAGALRPEKASSLQRGVQAGNVMVDPRERLAAIVESSSDAIVSKNLDGIVDSWNASAERIFGYTAEEMIGKPITTIIPPELRDEETMILNRLRSGQRIDHLETVRVTKSGKKINVSLTISPVRDSAGNVVGASKIARDITEQKRAAAALRESEERFRIMADNAPVMIWMAGADGGRSYFSRPWLEFTGRTLEQESGDGWSDGIHAEDRERCLQMYRSCLQSHQPFSMEYRLHRKDSEYRWVLDRGVPLYSATGEFNGYIGSCLDITEQRRVQDLLRQTHDDLEARVRERTAELERRTAQVSAQAELLDLANDAILVRSLDDRITYWNRGSARLYGWTKEEVLGKHPQDILRTEFPEPFENMKAQLLREGSWQGELIQKRRDGSTVIVASRWSTWSSKGGNPLGFLELNTDVTDRKRVEDTLRQMSGRLLQMQDEERRRIARELHDSAGQMLVAMDMNLTSVQREADRLSENAAAACQETVELVREMSKELRTMSHLLHPPLLDEAGLPSAVQWFVHGFAERSKIPVDLDLSPDLGRLSNEFETAIFRIVQEALTNIHRHSGSPTASIRIQRHSHEVKVEIADKGRGFSQERKRTLSAGNGTGVGIQGMRERIRQLGGRLQIDSGPQGTTIMATFPAEPQAAASIPGSQTAKVAS
jgi:PAS domain S-box-containing protein